MSKKIKTTFLVRLSGKDQVPMMFANDLAGRREAVDFAWHLLEVMPFERAEIWHLNALKIVAAINKSDNPDLK